MGFFLLVDIDVNRLPRAQTQLYRNPALLRAGFRGQIPPRSGEKPCCLATVSPRQRLASFQNVTDGRRVPQLLKDPK